MVCATASLVASRADRAAARAMSLPDVNLSPRHGSVVSRSIGGALGGVRNQPELTQVEANTVTRDRDRFGLRGVDFQTAAAED